MSNFNEKPLLGACFASTFKSCISCNWSAVYKIIFNKTSNKFIFTGLGLLVFETAIVCSIFIPFLQKVSLLDGNVGKKLGSTGAGFSLNHWLSNALAADTRRSGQGANKL